MRRKRCPITLLEVMIVILLIGLIGGVLSYNLKGTLDRGKKFRTEEGIKRLKEILDLEVARGAVAMQSLVGAEGYKQVAQCVRESGFITPSEVDKFLTDGWGEQYRISIEQGELMIRSPRLERDAQ